MKIQTRLSILTSLLFAIVFIFMSVLIYTLFSQRAEGSVYRELKKTSYITAFFFLEEDELNKNEFESIKSQFEEFVPNTYYQVYDQSGNLKFGTFSRDITPELLNEISKKKELSFKTEDFLCYGIFYEDNQGNFIIITKEKKDVLREQLNELIRILISCFIVGTATVVLLCRRIAKIAYRPFSKIIERVKNLSIKESEPQIESPGTSDELQDLTETFNELLSKISETFIIQKNFVSYISHEFRTPLTSMQGNLEVFSIKERSPAEYQHLAENLLGQIKQLEEMLDTLLVLSDLRKDTDINYRLRIDELIWDIIDKLSGKYPNSKTVVHLEIASDREELLYVSGNSTQLFMALFNLIENAVKYSSGQNVDIHIFEKEHKLHMSIKDNGIGIPPEQIENINKPFFRADNTAGIRGNGLGLSISFRMLEHNKIQYTINSKEGYGTTILLIFKT